MRLAALLVVAVCLAATAAQATPAPAATAAPVKVEQTPAPAGTVAATGAPATPVPTATVAATAAPQQPAPVATADATAAPGTATPAPATVTLLPAAPGTATVVPLTTTAPAATPEPNATAAPAVGWPVNPVTGKRYVGIKEFVIVLHDNIITDEKELVAWNASTLGVIVHQKMPSLRAKKAEWEAKLVPYEAKVEKLRKRIEQVQTEVNMLKKKVLYRKRAVDKARRTLRNADFHWNNTILHSRNQLDTAKNALKSVQAIFPLLNKPNAHPSVAQLLFKASDTSGGTNPTVTSMLQTAAQSAHDVKGVEEMEILLNQLLRELQAHMEVLRADLGKAKRSRLHHITGLKARLEPYIAQIQQLQKLVNASLQTIPDYEDSIRRIQHQELPIRKRIQHFENRLQQETDESALIEKEIAEEQELIKLRAGTIEAIHQNVKARLLSGSPMDRARLYLVENKLQPRGMEAMHWSTYFDPRDESAPIPNYPTNLRDVPPFRKESFGGVVSPRPYGIPVPGVVNPDDVKANLCAHWQFAEKSGSPFVIDSSKYGNDGVLHGGNARIRATRAGGSALLFDGMQTYVDVGKVGLLGQSLQEFTIDLWVRTLDTHPALSSILKYIEEGLTGVLAIEPNRRVGRPLNGIWPIGQQPTADLDFESGTTLMYLRDQDGKVLAGHVKAPYFDNRWHHLQWIVMDSELNQMAFYMDGKLYPWIATVEQGPANFRPLQSALYIGAGNNRGNVEGFFDGAISNVKIFCGKDVSKPRDPCCRVCSGDKKPCADMCISVNSTCHLEAGCACAPPPLPTEPPVDPHKWELETATWRRGASPLNEHSIFPGRGLMVPTKEDSIEFGPNMPLKTAGFF